MRRGPANGRSVRSELNEAPFDRRPIAGDCPDFRVSENGTVPFGAPIQADPQLRPAAGGDLFDQRRQLRQLAGAHDEIDVRGAAEDFVPILLGHAAEHGDEQFRPLLLDFLQPAQQAVDFVFGVLADAACV